MGNFYMESTQINYRRDEKLKTVDQKLQELSETSAIDTDIAPVFKSTNTYHPGDMVYYRNKLYVFNVEHTGAWAAADVTATDVTTELSSLKSGLTNYERDNNWRIEAPERKNHYDPSADRLTYDASHAWWLDSSVNKIASGGNTNYTWAVKCYPNTTYTVSLTHTSTTFRVAYGKMANLAWVTTDDTPKDIYGLQSNSETGDVSITITTGSDATYLFIQIGSSDVDTAKLTMQVEIGDTATTFTPYIPSVESRLDALEAALAQLTNG